MSTETQRADYGEPTETEILKSQLFSLRQMYGEARVAQASQAAEIEALRDLLNEVRACFTRDDDLPDDLLPRIDAAMQTKEAS